jgi:hypothetical protein
MYSSAQIILSSQDFLNFVGSKQTVLMDDRFSIPVDVGMAGSNQVWDFRATTIVDTLVSVFEYLSLQQTASHKTFPEANLVQKITSPSEPGFEIFNYFRVTNSEFINLGDSTKFMFPFDTTFVSFQIDTLAPLPLAFNNSWLTTEVDTTGFFPYLANISIDTTWNQIDAWGTVRLPLGDFQCLRIRQDVKVINHSIFNGTITSTDMESYIQYDWVAKNVFLVASAQSQNGETNPNFTVAQGFSLLYAISSPTNVVHGENPVHDFKLGQNYPNPSNAETTIFYDLPVHATVMLKIFDINGRQITILESAQKPASMYSMNWDGTDEFGNNVASGVYFYQLETIAQNGEKRSLTKKMTLLR